MKAEQFKELIRAIVKEEINKSLPTLVPNIIAEALSGKTPSVAPQTEDHEDFFAGLQSKLANKPVERKQKPQPPRQFSSNPRLNAALMETVGGIPSDPTELVPAVPPQFLKQPSQHLNVKNPPAPVSAPAILNEETKAQAELGVFKDYRKLMKAVDVKKKQGVFGGGSIGGLSIDPGTPNDFSTID